MSSKKDSDAPKAPKSAFSRRGFMQGVGIGSGAIGAGLLQENAQAATGGNSVGPGEVPITLWVNGKEHQLKVEPRVTLLNALRERLSITGAKRVCDRATCGACTVMVEGKAVYACSMLAIDAQNKNIQTIEGMSSGGEMHPMTKAFVEHDAQQCGFCTPGFVVAAAAFVKEHPNPTEEDAANGLGGNLCRCGTYMGIRKAVVEAAKAMGGKNA